MNINEFIAKHKISMTARTADRNPNMDSSIFDANASHYRCTLRMGTKRMTVAYLMGSAHEAPPTAADVLDCLASDSAGYADADDFEAWAEDYGYDPDSRKAERTYRIVGRQAERLEAFLGTETYAVLLWEVDKL